MQRVKNDDGAVAPLLAIMMVALLGMGTIVLDVGQLYAERRQLQNGADAAVLTLAQDCPTATGCSTDTSVGGQAGTKANQNANDNAATITQICGNAASLSPCSPPSDIGPWDCRPVPPGLASANYVQVRAETRQTGGGSLVPPALAGALVPGYTGTNVRACARASWGSPSSLTSALPLTISSCEFDFYTSSGTALAPSPPYPPYPAGYEKVIQFHGQDGPSPCPASNSGADLPGGFGWLSTGEDCVATTNADGWVPDDTGSSPSSSCDPSDLQSLLGKAVHVPVFDAMNGLTGSNGEYHIKGYAAFVLTGYYFTGGYREDSVVPGSTVGCSGSQRCIYGFFTQDLSPSSGTIGSAPSMGVTVVQMSG